MRVDAHQHYWNIARGDYGWITEELPILYRDYVPEDLNPLFQMHQLQGSIIVQAAPTLAETAFLLELSRNEESALGVVGWLDVLNAADREQFNRLRLQFPKLIGFRLMIQDMPDANAVLEPEFIQAMEEYARQDMPVDLLVRADQLNALNVMLQQLPGLRGALDHMGKPDIAAGEFDGWASEITCLSTHPGIYWKSPVW